MTTLTPDLVRVIKAGRRAQARKEAFGRFVEAMLTDAVSSAFGG